jgi:hypothetical protein
MPSARIKTLVVEDAHSLAEDLRNRGFAVEIVTPGQDSSEPVDLEITLEECDPEFALHHAEIVPDAQDLCVFVAPGALTEGYRPIQVIPLFNEPVKPPPAAQTVARPAAEIAPAVAAREELRKEKEALEEPAVLEGPEKFVPAEPAIPLKPTPAAPRPIPPLVKVAAAVSVEIWKAALLMAARARKVTASASAAAGKTISTATGRLAANQKLLMRTATLAGMGAVAAVSVLVLGTVVHRFAPLPSAVQPASQSIVLPATASASSTRMEPKPRAVTPQPSSKAKPRQTHNPEEDVVAKDYVVRFNKRPAAARTQAKKTAGVKHYSDLR